MKSILALDVATTTGWAFGRVGDRPLSGATTFGRKNGCEEDIWFDALKFINDRLIVLQPDMVAIEAPMQGGKSSQASIGLLLGLQAVIRTAVRARRPSIAHLVHCQSARKFFIGHGNLPGKEAKQRVKDRCVAIGWLTVEDATFDKADALCVWAFAAGLADPAYAAGFTALGASQHPEMAGAI